MFFALLLDKFILLFDHKFEWMEEMRRFLETKILDKSSCI